MLVNHARKQTSFGNAEAYMNTNKLRVAVGYLWDAFRLRMLFSYLFTRPIKAIMIPQAMVMLGNQREGLNLFNTRLYMAISSRPTQRAHYGILSGTLKKTIWLPVKC